MIRKKASKSQATMIAALWSGRWWGGSTVSVSESYVEPTIKVLIRNGWLEPSGSGKPRPNGEPTTVYVVSVAGIDALEFYLSDARSQAGRRCQP